MEVELPMRRPAATMEAEVLDAILKCEEVFPGSFSYLQVSCRTRELMRAKRGLPWSCSTNS
jgi:hypothetical protein